MVRLWCSQKPLTVVSERVEMSTSGEATALSPGQCWPSPSAILVAILGSCVAATATSPWGARGCLQTLLPCPPSPDPL